MKCIVINPRKSIQAQRLYKALKLAGVTDAYGKPISVRTEIFRKRLPNEPNYREYGKAYAVIRSNLISDRQIQIVKELCHGYLDVDRFELYTVIRH